MTIPPFLEFETPEEYEKYFLDNYCKKPIDTFDGFTIWFKHTDFFHAFYESSIITHKGEFSKDRASRMSWIKQVLTNKDCILKKGYDKEKKEFTDDRRVTVVFGDYVLIIGINRKKRKGFFITTFVANEETLDKIIRGPDWV